MQPNTVQFTCHTSTEGGKIARFVVKRRKLEIYESQGRKFIDNFSKKRHLSVEAGMVMVMATVRPILDPDLIALPENYDISPRIDAKLKKTQDLIAKADVVDDEARLNDSAAGMPMAALTIWYVMFRHRTGFFKIHPKLWQSIHVYYLEGFTAENTAWPLIKIAHGPYDNWTDKPEIELPVLDRINVWAFA
jgi:hypothetical protein